MQNVNIFGLSSTFETAADGGTLDYPNLSYIEETGEISSIKEYIVPIIQFQFKCLSDTLDCTCKEGMTWREYINSEYNTHGFYLFDDLVCIEYNTTTYNLEYGYTDSVIVENKLYYPQK